MLAFDISCIKSGLVIDERLLDTHPIIQDVVTAASLLTSGV